MSKSESKRFVEQLPPGSGEARKRGCACPVLDNSHGKGWMGMAGSYVISELCPLHGEAHDWSTADAEGHADA